MHDSVVFIIFTEFCDHHLYLIAEHFHHSLYSGTYFPGDPMVKIVSFRCKEAGLISEKLRLPPHHTLLPKVGGKKEIQYSKLSLSISPRLAPGSHWSTFCTYRFAFSGYFI